MDICLNRVVEVFDGSRTDIVVVDGSRNIIGESSGKSVFDSIDEYFLNAGEEAFSVVATESESFDSPEEVFEMVRESREPVWGVEVGCCSNGSGVEMAVMDVVAVESADGENAVLFIINQEGDGDISAMMSDAVKRYVNEVEKENKELRSECEEVQKVLRGVRHDVKGPIQAIMAHAGEITGMDSRHSEVIEQSAQQIQSIVDDTDLYCDDDDLSHREVSEIHVRDVVEQAWEHVTTNKSEVVVADSFTVTGNREQIIRLFENVFRNAVTHNDDPVTVTVQQHCVIGTTTRAEQRCGFSVSDDGCGVPDSVKETVFEFGETSGGGSGVGLAVVRRIADVNGWSVRVGDSDAGGAEFMFEPH